MEPSLRQPASPARTTAAAAGPQRPAWRPPAPPRPPTWARRSWSDLVLGKRPVSVFWDADNLPICPPSGRRGRSPGDGSSSSSSSNSGSNSSSKSESTAPELLLPLLQDKDDPFPLPTFEIHGNQQTMKRIGDATLRRLEQLNRCRVVRAGPGTNTADVRLSSNAFVTAQGCEFSLKRLAETRAALAAAPPPPLPWIDDRERWLIVIASNDRRFGRLLKWIKAKGAAAVIVTSPVKDRYNPKPQPDWARHPLALEAHAVIEWRGWGRRRRQQQQQQGGGEGGGGEGGGGEDWGGEETGGDANGAAADGGDGSYGPLGDCVWVREDNAVQTTV